MIINLNNFILLNRIDAGFNLFFIIVLCSCNIVTYKYFIMLKTSQYPSVNYDGGNTFFGKQREILLINFLLHNYKKLLLLRFYDNF